MSNRKTTVLVGAGRQTVVPLSGPPGPPKPVDLKAILAWVKNLPNTTAATGTNSSSPTDILTQLSTGSIVNAVA